ncbi:hypothetical protein JXB01_03330 [Candidatus Micrarchaeota archaeon]|nr:hypothetical protein [Candidatus Micrarchaeota archaeon]
MRQSSQKAISRASITSEALPSVEKFLEDSQFLLKPEMRIHTEILSDAEYRGLVTFSLGKEFGERTKLTEKDIERFTMVYDVDPLTAKIKMFNGIIPLRKKGYPWESRQSQIVRKNYKKKAEKLISRLETCDLSTISDSEIIELTNIPYKTLDYLEFSSAAALVDRKPRKRKGHNSGDSVFFKEFYVGGEKAVVFAVFDGISTNSNTDDISSSVALTLFKNIFLKSMPFRSKEEVFKAFNIFISAADRYLSKHLAMGDGVSVAAGLVQNGELYYLSLGDCRIYGVSLNGEGSKVKKITMDDGMGGLVERGAVVDFKEFYRQLKSPEIYAGAFSQKVFGKKGSKVLHSDITLKSPNIGNIKPGCDLLIVATDGFWSNLPMNLKGGKISDASGSLHIEKLLSGSDTKNVKSIVESLYKNAKSNMGLKTQKIKGNSVISPNRQDIGILCFAV